MGVKRKAAANLGPKRARPSAERPVDKRKPTTSATNSEVMRMGTDEASEAEET